MTSKFIKKSVTFSEIDTIHIIPNEKWSREQINERIELLNRAILEYKNEYWQEYSLNLFGKLN